MARPNRSERIEARTTPAILALVKRAAKAQGRSLSDFVVEAAADAAERTLEAAKVIRLTADEQRRFVDALLRPSPPSPAWRRAKAAHTKLFGAR
jgi:uncharacterized protein (DUF1778 family)